MDLMAIEGRMHAEQSQVYHVDLPDGKVGAWSLSKVTVKKTAAQSIQNMRMIRDGFPEYVASPGTYQRLMGPCKTSEDTYENGVMMSNTQLEYRTNKDFVESARGDVLVIGLGIGMLIRPLARRKKVKSITVLEVEPDVIKLVKPHYADVSKLYVTCADAYDFEAGDLMGNRPKSWDCIMIDIWPDINAANLPDMVKLQNRYRQFLNPKGKVECWSMNLCRRQERFAKQLDAQLARVFA